ncbi:MAG: SGNH/GDSL hydrolase family protein [Pseudomonadota bacterium]
MDELILLGDSVIDNATYVRAGEPDVSAQIQSLLPDWQVAMRAVDGHVSADVAAGLDAHPLPPGSCVFLSAGGNDALGSIGLLSDPDDTSFPAAMIRLRQVREAFRGLYAPLLDRLADTRALVATIYNPAFAGEEADLQAPAEGALSAFNDVIQAEALARGFDILDLRRIFTGSADYANPIEPSAHGGAKLARAVADWARG